MPGIAETAWIEHTEFKITGILILVYKCKIEVGHWHFLFGNKYNCLAQMLGYHQVCNDALFLEKQIFGKKANYFSKGQLIL